MNTTIQQQQYQQRKKWSWIFCCFCFSIYCIFIYLLYLIHTSNYICMYACMSVCICMCVFLFRFIFIVFSILARIITSARTMFVLRIFQFCFCCYFFVCLMVQGGERQFFYLHDVILTFLICISLNLHRHQWYECACERTVHSLIVRLRPHRRWASVPEPSLLTMHWSRWQQDGLVGQKREEGVNELWIYF